MSFVLFMFAWVATGIGLDAAGVEAGWIYMTCGGLIGSIYGVCVGVKP